MNSNRSFILKLPQRYIYIVFLQNPKKVDILHPTHKHVYAHKFLDIKIGKLLYVKRVSNGHVAIESPSCHDDIHSLSWMKRIPKHILVSIQTRHLVWKTCYLSPVPPNPTAPSIRHCESYVVQSNILVLKTLIIV